MFVSGGDSALLVVISCMWFGCLAMTTWLLGRNLKFYGRLSLLVIRAVWIAVCLAVTLCVLIVVVVRVRVEMTVNVSGWTGRT